MTNLLASRFSSSIQKLFELGNEVEHVVVGLVVEHVVVVVDVVFEQVRLLAAFGTRALGWNGSMIGSLSGNNRDCARARSRGSGRPYSSVGS